MSIHFNNLEPIDTNLSEKLATEWHQLYCPANIAWVKYKPIKSYRWEFLDNELIQSQNADAYTLYKQQNALEYFVMPESYGDGKAQMYKTTSLPFVETQIPRLDCYVFPKNMAWCMAFTHEAEWIGPFFLMHREYRKLQQKKHSGF